MVAVGAIIQHASTGKVLVIKRWNGDDYGAGQWDCPCGRLKQFEIPEDGLRREVFEEAGLSEINIIKPLRTFHYFHGDQKPENEVIGITYWCKTESNVVKLSAEHDEFKWLDPQEALGLVGDSPVKNDLLAYLTENIEQK